MDTASLFLSRFVYKSSLLLSVSQHAAPESRTLRLVRVEFVQESLRPEQVLGVEAFGEPVVDWGEQLIRVLALALAVPQPCQAGRRAQLPHPRLLGARPLKRK